MSPANLEMDSVGRYARYARALCTLCLAVTAAGVCYYLVRKLPDAPTPGGKFWITVGALSSTFSCVFIYLLRRLFDNLAGGEIFSSRNVGHFRNIAYLFCAKGCFQVLVLFAYAMLTLNGAIEETVPSPGRREPENVVLFGVFSSLTMAGVLWLASWVMQVGLGVRREADELKREAELVV